MHNSFRFFIRLHFRVEILELLANDRSYISRMNSAYVLVFIVITGATEFIYR
jgi:hypothetical protein